MSGPPDEADRLREEIAELRAAVHARDEFIAVAAHELRNPMTPLLILVQSLQAAAASDPTTPPRIVRGLERLDLAVARYIRRSTTLLDISRLTSGSFRPELEAMDLAAVVRDVLTEMQPYVGTSGSALDAQLCPELPAVLDRLAVQQITENLVSNAVKYGQGRPISVALQLDGDEAVLTVRDNGVGIAETDRARIFARFERAVTRQTTSGFGVGLWVVGRLVEALHGQIGVDSAVGEGSTFTVRLPLDASAPA